MRKWSVRVARAAILLAGGVLGGALLQLVHPPRPIVITTGIEGVPPTGKKMGVAPTPPTSMFAAQFNPLTTDPMTGAAVGLYYDSGLVQLRARSADGTYTELAPAFSRTSSNRTITLGNQLYGADSTSDYVMRYQPTDAVHVDPWHIAFGDFNNNLPGHPHDHTVTQGWNCGAGGMFNTNPGYGGLCDAWEQFFDAAQPQMERHLIFWDPTGASHRLISFEGHLSDNTTTIGIDATTMLFGIGTDLGHNVPVFQSSGGSGATSVTGPLTNRTLLQLDDVGLTSVLQSTNGVSTGEIQVTAGQLNMIGTGTNPIFRVDMGGIRGIDVEGGTTALYGGDLNNGLQVTGTGTGGTFYFNIGGGTVATINENPKPAFTIGGANQGQVYTYQTALGDNSGRPDQTLALMLSNLSAATVGTPVQQSPTQTFRAEILNTNGNVNELDDWSIGASGTSGNPPVRELRFVLDTDGANATTKMTINNSGTVTAAAFQTSTATIAASGGNATASFATNDCGNGGSRPTTATQNGWLQMKDSTGATVWVPTWK